MCFNQLVPLIVRNSEQPIINGTDGTFVTSPYKFLPKCLSKRGLTNCFTGGYVKYILSICKTFHLSGQVVASLRNTDSYMCGVVFSLFLFLEAQCV